MAGLSLFPGTVALRNRLAELFSPASPNGNGAKVAAPPIEEKAALPSGLHFVGTSAEQVALVLNGRALDADQLTRRTAYAAAITAYACIRYRAEKLIEAPLYVFQEDENGDREWVRNHPLAEVLESPSLDLDMSDLLEETSVYMDIGGRCLWWKIRDNGRRVARLKAFAHDEFDVASAPDEDTGEWRTFGKFTVYLRGGRRELTPADVVYYRFLDPNDRHQGLSPLDVALGQLNLSHALRRRITKALSNVAMLSGLMSAKTELTDKQYERAKAELQVLWAGINETGRPGLVEGDATWQSMMLDFRQFAYGDLEREVEAKVCLAFRVRPEVLGAQVGLENSPWSHIDVARRLTYEDCIEPLWKRYERALTRQLLRPVDQNRARLIAFDRSKIPALQEDAERQARIGRIAMDILSDNERRQMIGKEPRPEPEHDDVRGRQAPPAIAPPAAVPTDEKRRRLERKAEPDLDLAWALFDVAAKAQEPSWERPVLAQLRKDRDEVLRLFDRELKCAPAPERKAEEPPADPEAVRRLIEELAAKLDMARAWRDVVDPLIDGTGTSAVQRMAAELAIDFDLLQPGLLEYVQREAAFLVTSVEETTKQGIRDALVAGLRDGESIQKLRGRIAENPVFDRPRAELIARTETTRVTNGAARDSLSAYQAESGRVAMKTWVSARDSRVRDAHRAMDGKQLPVDEVFQVPGEGEQQAPSYPNCRCTLIYSIAEAAS